MARSAALETKRTTAQRVRDYRGPALFSFGFRPFFLLAALFSLIAIPLWVANILGWEALGGALTRDWHVHEMLFGYTSAVIVGYLIIAGANWTGHYPVTGGPVIALTALWLAGRVAPLAFGDDAIATAVIDGAFLPIFAAALWREQSAARNGRNLAPCIIVSLLAAANIAFHLREVWPGLQPVAERSALGLITLLIALMGGRLIPSFMQNWAKQQKRAHGLGEHGRYDKGCVAFTAAALLLWQVAPDARITGACLVAAGGCALVRLLRWRGWRAWREPLLWGLHLGYLWIVLGLALLGGSILAPASIPRSGAIHALTVGGIGLMTLAMMTRTALSHTGRARRSGRLTALLYLLLSGAAALRIAGSWAPALLYPAFAGAAACWGAAFLLFLLAYGPMLVRRKPRA